MRAGIRITRSCAGIPVSWPATHSVEPTKPLQEVVGFLALEDQVRALLFHPHHGRSLASGVRVDPDEP